VSNAPGLLRPAKVQSLKPGKFPFIKTQCSTGESRLDAACQMSAIINTLRAAVEAVPDSWEARLGLIEALLNEERRDEAVQVLLEVGELPVNLNERVKAGRAYGLLDPANGLEVISGILKEQPTHAAAHKEKATICHRIGDHATAQQHYFTATTFDASLADSSFAAELAKQVEAQNLSSTVGDGLPASIPEETAGTAVPPPPSVSRDAVYYPSPGQFPVRTLREALGMPPIGPLVDPDTIPELPDLEYQKNPAFLEPLYTRYEIFCGDLHNVCVIPHREREVVYDYQAPDDSIFDPDITPDNIYVAALVTDTGAPVASFRDSVREREKQQQHRLAGIQKRNQITSLAVALGMVGAIVVLLALIVITLPVSPPPIITASIVEVPDDTIDQEQVQRYRQRPQSRQPPAAASPPPIDAISVAAASPIAMPDLETTSVGTGLDGLHLGMGYGNSMTLGGPGGDGFMFMGSKTRGDLAVVFDITNSMYDATPVVIEEIKRVYRNAQVVCVFGGGFKEEEFSGLVSYRKNQKVRAIVDHYDQGKITADLNKALFSLRRCDSLKVDHQGDFRQSVGAGIEALLNQSAAPGTIYVFSDFEDGLDPEYMDKIKRLVQRRDAKIVFWYPFNERKPKWNAVRKHYETFVKDTGGELREEVVRGGERS